MSHRQLYVVAALLAAVGLALFLYKVVALGFPLEPEAEREVWTVEARLTFTAGRGPVKAVLQIPSGWPGYAILDESFISRGYGVSTSEGEGHRRVEWAKRRAPGRQTLYYRALVQAGASPARPAPPPYPPVPDLEEPYQTALATLLDDVRAHSADVATFVKEVLKRLDDPTPPEHVALFLRRVGSPDSRAQVAVTLLAGARIPAQVIHGVRLGESQRRVTPVPWLAVWNGDRWLFFDPASGEEGLPEGFLIWWQGEGPLVEVEGGRGERVEISVQRTLADALTLAERRAELLRSRVVELSLLSLPIQTQAVYGVLLMVPVGAFIIALLRNVAGVRTIGTFMPVLVALSFRETRLLTGILLFTLLVALGLSVRFYLERLRLLMVPRIASVLIVVVLLMVAVGILSHRLSWETGLSVALFPMVILTMAIEHMSIVWEERGAQEAILQGLGTLLVAALAYALMSLRALEHLIFLFPELLLVVLAATLLLGRYSGYRLLELFRFRMFRGESG